MTRNQASSAERNWADLMDALLHENFSVHARQNEYRRRYGQSITSAPIAPAATPQPEEWREQARHAIEK